MQQQPQQQQPSQQGFVERRVHMIDPLWDRIRHEAAEIVKSEPALSTFIYNAVLLQHSLVETVISRIAHLLDHPDVSSTLIRLAGQEALRADQNIAKAIRADIVAVLERDPACTRTVEPVLYFKGFHAIQTHRIAHWLYKQGRKDFAYYLQSRASAVFQVDINPASHFGVGIFFDHATGIVIGETARLGNDVSILQGVTLGGTGKEEGDRHPKIGNGVLISAGASVLGNIVVGDGSRVGAGSVVLQEVPPCKTVAGVPSKIIGDAGCVEPARNMNQNILDCC
jgi:serine O-acetyltransferase